MDIPAHIHITRIRDLYIAICLRCGAMIAEGRSIEALKAAEQEHACPNSPAELN